MLCIKFFYKTIFLIVFFMHKTILNLQDLEKQINSKAQNLKLNYIPKIIAVSKTFSIEKIVPLIDYGHFDFGENKVQEALKKWSDIKEKNHNLKLHLIGKLQTNKVKHAVKLFDFIHSVDNKKLAHKIAEESLKQNRKIKNFIQVNIGGEEQKSGVQINDLENFYQYCVEINLDIVGIMCIPPINRDSKISFKKMENLKQNLNLKELSMGMSSDYMDAIEFSTTYVRIGSKIFGNRN